MTKVLDIFLLILIVKEMFNKNSCIFNLC